MRSVKPRARKVASSLTNFMVLEVDSDALLSNVTAFRVYTL